MPAPRHVESRQQQPQQYHDQNAVEVGSKLKSDFNRFKPATGLDISYEGRDDTSYYADESERAMGWDKVRLCAGQARNEEAGLILCAGQQRDMPVPRNIGNKVFRPAYDPETDTSNRIDSVFDVYADMYAEQDAEQDEDGDVANYYGTAIPEEDEDEEEYASPPQAREPWDQRGKNGLYGGGGRGADDQETGWVSNYGPGRESGVEEDLRFDEQQDTPRTQRTDSQATHRDERRRSSSDTEHSSYGPVTPTNTSFSGPAGGPHIAQADSGYRSHGSPSSTKAKDSHATGFSHPPPMPHQSAIVIPTPTSPSTLKKKAAPPSKSSAPAAPAVDPMQRVNTSLLQSAQKKKSTGFKWTGRSKKAPVISKPILPDGFVESLGMETFTLTPGCSAPNHLLHQPSLAMSRPSNSAGSSEHGSSAGSVKSGGRKDAPRPRKIPNRPNFLPALKLGEPVDMSVPISHPDGTSSLPREESPLPTPVRLPLAALRNSSGSSEEQRSSAYSHEVNDAFRRLSRDSEVSYAPSTNTIASAEKTRRLYFNGIREDRARQADQEVQANRGPVLANAPAIPPIPSRYADEVESPQHSTPVNRHGSTDSGFRNPWGPASGTRTSGGSFNIPGHRGSKSSMPKGWTGEPRSSTNSGGTIHQFSSSYTPHSLSAPIVESSVSQDSYIPAQQDEDSDAHLREDRQGSTSSAYSEYSTATTPDYPTHVQDFPTTPSPPPTQPLYSSFPMAGQQPHRRGSLVPPSQAHGGTPIAQTAPLKLRRQQNEDRVLPSAQGATAPQGGFNNWGHQEGEGYSFPPQQQQQPREIGTTGFRNPFG